MLLEKHAKMALNDKGKHTLVLTLPRYEDYKVTIIPLMIDINIRLSPIIKVLEADEMPTTKGSIASGTCFLISDII